MILKICDTTHYSTQPICCHSIPQCSPFPHMVYSQDSISHRGHTHNSTRRWPWSTSCNAEPQGLSTSEGSSHHWRRNNQHLANLSTCQSLQSTNNVNSTQQGQTRDVNLKLLKSPCICWCPTIGCSWLPNLCARTPCWKDRSSLEQFVGNTPAAFVTLMTEPSPRDCV